VKLLGIETSTEQCSAALWDDGRVLARSVHAPREHTARVLPMIAEVLAEGGLAPSALDAIAFGRGPGSFTGLRIAAGIAQGLALGLDRPVVPVSSLAALAHSVDAPRVIAALDARLGEVYVGLYARAAGGLMALRGEERLCAPGDVPVPRERGWTGAGSAFAAHHDALAAHLGATLTHTEPARHPQAGALVVLAAAALARGEAVDAAQALPVYLRERVTNTGG
jgi:tRNA threonylcarbamoyladenosine biosynthesis protein TsaB